MEFVHKLKRLCARFAQDRGGAFYLMVAVSAPLFLGMVGMAVDISNATALRERLETTAESVALMTARRAALDPATNAGELEAFARAAVTQSLGGEDAYSVSIEVDPEDVSAKVTINQNSPTPFLSMLGYDSFDVVGIGRAEFGRARVEIALVMDNTLSMSAAQIQAVKNAGQAIIDEVTSGASGETEFIKVAVVPFQGLVRVGVEYADADWVDVDAESSIHHIMLTEFSYTDANGDV